MSKVVISFSYWKKRKFLIPGGVWRGIAVTLLHFDVLSDDESSYGQ